MIKLYLITGFLGAGKTTLLKNLIRQMSGLRIRVIVNEFGKEGIDGILLSETGAKVEEINNGSIFCSCRLDEFEDVLKKVYAESPDVILVEASGLSDPTHIEKVLKHLSDVDELSYIGGICLVDAVSFKKVLSTARVCRKQVMVSDLVMLNKSDLVSEETLSETEALILELKPTAVIHRALYGSIKLPWLDDMSNSAGESAGPVYHIKDVSLQKMRIVLRNTMTYTQLESFLSMFLEDTYRVKGFVCLENRTSLVDCVGPRLMIHHHTGKAEHCNVLVAMAGGGMPMEHSIREAAQWYTQFVEKVEWDE